MLLTIEYFDNFSLISRLLEAHVSFKKSVPQINEGFYNEIILNCYIMDTESNLKSIDSMSEDLKSLQTQVNSLNEKTISILKTVSNKFNEKIQELEAELSNIKNLVDDKENQLKSQNDELIEYKNQQEQDKNKLKKLELEINEALKQKMQSENNL